MKSLFLVIVFIAIQGCANQPVAFKADAAKSSYLELCLDFATKMTIDDKLLYLDAVNTFIETYNAEQRAREPSSEIHTCSQASQVSQEKDRRRVTLIIQRTRYVSPSEQLLYVVISGVGLYSLISGGYGFAWASLSSTTLGVALSDGIAGQQKVVYRRFSSWPYFHDLPEVKQKHMKQFQYFMFELFDELLFNEVSFNELSFNELLRNELSFNEVRADKKT